MSNETGGPARVVWLIPAGKTKADLAGWPCPLDQFGDRMEFLRAPYPPDLHHGGVSSFQAWAEGADRRLAVGGVTVEAVRAEYEAALTEAIQRSDELKAAEVEAYLARRDVVPQEYRKPIDRARLKNPAAFDAVQVWRPEGEQPGLLCAGDTGRGKTRAVFARLAALYRSEGLAFVAVSSDALKQRLIDLSQRGLSQRGGWDEDAAASLTRSTRAESFLPADVDTLGVYVAKLQTVPVLFIDDLGQAKITPLYAEKLFALIEHRTREGRSVVVTVQSRPPELVRKLAGWGEEYADTAKCLVRRLGDFCRPIDFGFPNDADAAS